MSSALDTTPSDPWVDGILHGQKAFAGPEHVVIDLTNRCNMHCLACWTKSPLLRDKSPSEEWHRQTLAEDIACRFIDELAAMGTRIVRFSGGGEPLQHPSCIALLGRVKARKMRACLTTNLAYINPAKAKELLDTGLDELAVSVWAADPETYRLQHPDLSRPDAVFTRITDTLTMMGHRKRPNLRVTICNVISNLNYHQLVPMVHYAAKVGADSVYFALVDPVPGRTDCLLLSSEERLDTLAKLDEAVAVSSVEVENLADIRRRLAAATADTGGYDAQAVDEQPCTIGWLFCRVLADGSVVPCCRAVHRPMGNLNEAGFGAIWHGERYNQFRAKALALPKTDSFFADIGCRQSCDNVAHIQGMHSRLPSGWDARKIMRNAHA